MSIPKRLADFVATIDAEILVMEADIAQREADTAQRVAALHDVRKERDQILAPFTVAPADPNITDPERGRSWERWEHRPAAPNITDPERGRCWEHRPRRGSEMSGPPIPRDRRLRVPGLEEERHFPGNGYRTQAKRLGVGTMGAGRVPSDGGVWLTWNELNRMIPAVSE